MTKKSHKFKIGDTLIVREPSTEDMKEFEKIQFNWEGQKRKKASKKEFVVRGILNGYISGNPYYAGDDYLLTANRDSVYWYPEILLSLKSEIKELKMVKLNIGGQEITVPECIANLIK